ncbi:hypothetical protein, partial [Pseudomonas atacamensis]|uniref:hypothetical protein n=1 Tax=Pseudomonas atacamensis TaxID=2565368 RepID=UPI002B1E3586
KPFRLPFRRLEKVTRRKGETASRNTTKKRISTQTNQSLVGPKAAKPQKTRKCQNRSATRLYA